MGCSILCRVASLTAFSIFAICLQKLDLPAQLRARRLQYEIDLCSGDVKAESCAKDITPKCDLSGRYCFLYDAGYAFCPENFEYFEPPFGGGMSANGPVVCSTTTTTTYTDTSTTTWTSTIFTSTSEQPVECRIFCHDNSQPWVVKCGWAVCAACSECAAVVFPTTAAPIVIPTLLPQALVRASRNTSSNVSTTGPSGQNDQQNSIDAALNQVIQNINNASSADSSLQQAIDNARPANVPVIITTTAAPVISKTCLRLCKRAADDGETWDRMCSWATCVACPECPPRTSTYFLTTTVVTTTSFTLTNTDTTVDPPTNTFTATSSRTSSTITDTSTTTMTTTTTDIACVAASPVLRKMMSQEARTDGCNLNITPGDSCIAPLLKHPCFYEDGDLLLQCPANNIEYREPRLVRGTWQHKCKICAFADDNLTDSDWRPAWIQTRIRFGAMAILGTLDESMINGYGIFIVDNCSRPLKRGMLDFVAKNDWATYDRYDCCNPTAYDVSLELEVPPDYTSVYLMVVPNATDVGFLPVGQISMEIMDWNSTDPNGCMHMSLPFGYTQILLMLSMGVFAPNLS